MTVATQAVDPNRVQDEMLKFGDKFNPKMANAMRNAMAALSQSNAAAMAALLQEVADAFDVEFPISTDAVSINQNIDTTIEENVTALVTQSITKQLKAADNAQVMKRLSALVDELVSKRIEGLKEELKKK
jgi:hypothetical protein